MDIDIEVIELLDVDGFRIEALLPNGHSVGYINIIKKEQWLTFVIYALKIPICISGLVLCLYF